MAVMTPYRRILMMRTKLATLIISVLFAVQSLVAVSVSDQKGRPTTRREAVAEILHGTEIVDYYRWLEDQNSPETREWIDAQNAYTESLLSVFPEREQLKRRLAELMKVDVINMPLARNGRYFFTKRSAEQDLSVIYLREGIGGRDQILIDPHSMSDDLRTSVNISAVSKDGKLLVYGVRQGGEDEVEVRIFDVDKRKDLDRMAKARYFGMSITPDNKTLYYTRHGAKGSRVFSRELESDLSQAQEIFGSGYGPGKIIFPSLSDDGRFLLIHVLHGSAGKTEIYFKDLLGEGPFVTVVSDMEARTFGQIADSRLLLQTDWNAPNKRILAVDLLNPPSSPSEWTEIIPESEAILTGFSLAGGKLFVNYLENVISEVKVFSTDGRYLRDISFPAIGSVGGVNGTWASNEAFFSYSSFHIPRTIYRYDIKNGEMNVWAKLDLPINSQNIEVKQVWYESKDQTRAPMFLVHTKGLKLDGTNPTYLTGYGGFNVSRTPRFSSTAARQAGEADARAGSPGA
ncbi:hypothetical protein MJD09_01340, partial [bacterium]|nr:hypothetical protein [bacterium]